jgi:hypothetical protein
MDGHFAQMPLEKNLPVLMALIGIWNTNFLGATTHAVLPYSSALRLLPAYLQQLEMESNGKRVDREGREIEYSTSPVVWGMEGTASQHSFHQLLHQGTQTSISSTFLRMKFFPPTCARRPRRSCSEPAIVPCRLTDSIRETARRARSGSKSWMRETSGGCSRCTSTRCSPRA